MKYLMKKKFLPITLMLALIMGVIFKSGTLSNANEVSYEQENIVSEKELPKIGDLIDTVTEDGIDYVVTSYKEGDTIYSQAIATNGKIRKDFIFTNNKKNLKIVEYKKVSKQSEDIMYIVVDSKTVDLEVVAMNIEKNLRKLTNPNSRYEWDKKIHDAYKGDLWYSDGKSSYGNQYLRIGRKATYRIPIYKLSEDQKDDCQEYVDLVDKTNTQMLYMTATYGASLVADALAIISTGGLAAGAAVFLTAVGMIKEFSNLIEIYEDAADSYNSVKLYGERE